MLHGREDELAAIDALLGQARAGQGGALVLCGEPGIGKTALLAYAVERAGDMCVLRATGVPPEADLGYAGLHQLLHPIADRTPKLAGTQAEALDAAFGRAAGQPPDRFLVA